MSHIIRSHRKATKEGEQDILIFRETAILLTTLILLKYHRVDETVFLYTYVH